MRNGSRISRLIAVATLAFGLVLPSARADSTFDQVCGQVLQNPNANSTTQQQAQYCQAAKVQSNQVNADNSLTLLWGAAAAVCTAACVTPSVGATFCYGTGGLAAVDDVMQTHDASTLFSAITGGGASGGGGIGAMAMPLLMNGSLTKSVKGSKTACDVAIYSALEALATNQAKATAQAAYETNLQNAEALASANQAALSSSSSAQSGSFTGPIAAVDPLTGTVGATSNTAGVTATSGSAIASTSDSCATAAVTGSFNATVSCATAANSTVPALLTSPNLGQAFETATGTSFPTYATSGNTGPAALSQAMGSSLNPAAQQALSSALQTAASGLGSDAALAGTAPYSASPADTSPALYYGTFAGAGAGANRAPASDPNNALNSLVQTLADKMNGAKKPGATPDALTSMEFGGKGVDGQNFLGRQDLSIFARVSRRYNAVESRFTPLP